MRFVGVDPGKLGGMAVLDEGGQILELIPTPMIAGGKLYDLPAIAAILRNRADPRLTDRGLFVTVERLHPMPMRFAKKGGRAEDADANVGGTIANFNRGVAQGWAWMLAAFRIPHELVLPQAWQRKMLAGMPGSTTKEKSIAGAKRVWPSVDLRRTPKSRKDDDGLADALWLAEHGRRHHQGGAVFAAAARSSGGGIQVICPPPGAPPMAD